MPSCSEHRSTISCRSFAWELMIWGLISSFLTEGGGIFTTSASYIKQIRLPFSVYVYRSAWSKLIIFAHNFLIYFGVLIYFKIWPGAVRTAGDSRPSPRIVLNGALGDGLYRHSCRRDFAIFRSWSVHWFRSFSSSRLFIRKLRTSYRQNLHCSILNPFYHLVEIVRGPLLGQLSPPWTNYLVVLLLFTVFQCRPWPYTSLRVSVRALPIGFEIDENCCQI